MASTQRAFLIDGTALCYRAYYAIQRLSTAAGTPTNAIYGVTVSLRSLLEKEKPDYIAVAFDRGEPTFRHESYAEYKAERPPMPESLEDQLEGIREVVEAMRIPVFECAGYEGEDIMATLALAFKDKGVEVYLVTGDKDMLQLVDAQIKVYNPSRNGVIIYDKQEVERKYGIGPGQIIDMLALMGDKVDNIPGVPGIGEKTAVELLRQFGSLDAIYENLEAVRSASQRKKLEENRDSALLSRELATITAKAPVKATLKDLARKEPDTEALRKLYTRYEFSSLLKQLGEEHAAVKPAEPSFAVRFELLDAARAADALKSLNDAPCAIELLEGEGQALLWTADGEVVRACRLDAADKKLCKALESYLANPSKPKVGHDLKRCASRLAALGLTFDGFGGDTMLMGYLLNQNRAYQELPYLFEKYLELSAAPAGPLAETADAAALRNDAVRVAGLWRLHGLLLAELEAAGLVPLYRELELPLLRILWKMEANGVALDVPYLNALQREMCANLERLRAEILEMAGVEFNLNSPKQLAHVLFEVLGLTVVKKTKTGPSTDSEVLNKLAEEHALPSKLLEYREVAKLVSTYVEALPKLVNPRTGRLHTSFNQTVAATGRLSSSDPNLQNIPVKTELGRSIRKAFIPGSPSDVLLAADYSQIELRILAHYTQDEHLLEAFREDRDIHRFTASLIYGLPEEEITHEQRSAMKAVNFGILYGMSARGLSRELGCGFQEAHEFIRAYFKRYPGVKRYMDEQIEHAKKHGYVQTLFGRRRAVPEISSNNAVTRQFGERIAINTPIQGTAADLIKRAMVDLSRAPAKLRLEERMLLQVHDELIFECPPAEIKAVGKAVRGAMEKAVEIGVPLKVTLKSGPNWSDMRPLEI